MGKDHWRAKDGASHIHVGVKHVLVNEEKRLHMLKLVLIERDSSLYASWENLSLKKTISNLSVQEIVSKYQGFEGELVEIFEIEENENNLKIKIEEFLKYKNLGSCFTLFINSKNELNFPFFKKYAINLGFDVGVCAEEEDEIYSSIFHEILFGNVEELVEFKNSLNQYFLFNDMFTADQYVNMHNKMAKLGKDVEDYMSMKIYGIWKLIL